MVWIVVIVNTLTLLLFVCTAQPTSKDVDISSLNEYVKKMDAVLHEVQSHSKAQEQKYSAVLSSVLSQLTQTTEELRTSKNVTEELQQEVENMKEELKNVKENNNTRLDYTTAMEELAELKQSHNQSLTKLEQSHNQSLSELSQSLNQSLTELSQSLNQSLVELELVKSEVKSLQHDCNGSFFKSNSTVQGLSQLNSTQAQILVSFAEVVEQMNATGYIQPNGPKWPWLYKDVGFEANLASEILVSESGRIIFDNVNHNEGNGYDKTTGYFTAPESGMYFFWTNIGYQEHKPPIVFHIKTKETILGRAYGTTNGFYGTAIGTTSFYLKKGDRVWISSKMAVHLRLFTSAGAVLIKQY